MHIKEGYLLGLMGILVLAALFVGWRWERADITETPSGNDSAVKAGLGSACTEDKECVPVSCCHARACVAESEKPVCTGIRCTLSCEPGTLDCGQARCGCVNNKCAVVPE